MKTNWPMTPGLTRDAQAKALVRGMTETALDLIDAAKIEAAADRLQTAVEQLRAYAKAQSQRGRGSMRGNA